MRTVTRSELRTAAEAEVGRDAEDVLIGDVGDSVVAVGVVNVETFAVSAVPPDRREIQ